MKSIACIEDPVVIEKIMAHLKTKEGEQDAHTSRLAPTSEPPEVPGLDQGRCGQGDCRVRLGY